MTMKSQILRLTKNCNQTCKYCYLQDLHTGQTIDLNLLPEIIEKDTERIYLTGGEATSTSLFYDVIDYLFSIKMKEIVLQTNASAIYFRKRPDVFLNLKYFISVPSLNEDGFYSITQNKDKNGFDKFVDNLNFLSENEMIIDANMVISYKENFKYFSETLEKLLKLKIYFFNISNVILPEYRGSEQEDWNNIDFKNILETIEKNNKFVNFDGFPPCVLPKEAFVQQMGEMKSTEIFNNEIKNSVSEKFCGGNKKAINECKDCIYYNYNCNGFPIDYYNFYGEENVRRLLNRYGKNY